MARTLMPFVGMVKRFVQQFGATRRVKEMGLGPNEQGQKDGSEATGFDHMVQTLGEAIAPCEPYDSGWHNGYDNQPQDDDDD